MVVRPHSSEAQVNVEDAGSRFMAPLKEIEAVPARLSDRVAGEQNDAEIDAGRAAALAHPSGGLFKPHPHGQVPDGLPWDSHG